MTGEISGVVLYTLSFFSQECSNTNTTNNNNSNCIPLHGCNFGGNGSTQQVTSLLSAVIRQVKQVSFKLRLT